MNKAILLPLMLAAGAVVGSGAAYGTSLLMGPRGTEQRLSGLSTFVPVTDVLAPLVLGDGRLAGYASFNLQLGVAADQADSVQARLPLLLHAINLRTYRKPMATGPDGVLPDIGLFKAVVMDAADEAFGRGVVQSVSVTKASPA